MPQLSIFPLSVQLHFTFLHISSFFTNVQLLIFSENKQNILHSTKYTDAWREWHSTNVPDLHCSLGQGSHTSQLISHATTAPFSSPPSGSPHTITFSRHSVLQLPLKMIQYCLTAYKQSFCI